MTDQAMTVEVGAEETPAFLESDLQKTDQSAQPKETSETPPEQSVQAAAEGDRAAAEQALERQGLDISAFEQEYQDNGGLSEASYEALAQAGLSRETVDKYVHAVNFMAAQQVTELKSLAGGEQAYNEMCVWAQANLSPAEREAFDRAVSTDLESARLAITGLHARYAKAEGQPPSLVSGRATANGGRADVFTSYAQVSEAMSDPRYRTDPAYIRMVEEKVARSHAL